MEILMEELMAKLKEDLVKGQKQGAVKEDIVKTVLREEGLVQNEVVAKMRDKNILEDIIEKEDVFKGDFC